MTGWLLDTNILSELRRPKPERKVLAFVAAQPLDLLLEFGGVRGPGGQVGAHRLK